MSSSAEKPKTTLRKAVLFIHHANDMYGADVGLLHSIQALDSTKYYPIVILPADVATGMLSPELEHLGVEFYVAPLGILRRKYLSLRSVVSLASDFARGIAYVRSTIHRRGIALIYVNTLVAASGAIAGRIAGVPVIWHVREILTIPRPIRWALHKALQFCASQIICISNAVRDSLLKEAPYLAERVVIVYNAVSVRSNNEHEIQLREELGIPQSAPLVGTVGRITHWKGQEVLAEAANLVLQNHPDAHFVAVGSYFADESQYLEKLESSISDLRLNGRFHLTGYRLADANLYRAFDVFVLPSRNPEPFGRVTVEAMMEGRAVIATNHGGTCELIQEGVTGMLVPPSDPKSLAAAINLLLDNPNLRKKLGEAAAIHATEHFGFSRYQAELRHIIERVIAS